MASQCLSHCCVFESRLWQILGTAKQMQQLQSCWQGLFWVWWATLYSGRTGYGWLQKILQGAGWTVSSRCVFECHPIQAITCDHLCSIVLKPLRFLTGVLIELSVMRQLRHPLQHCLLHILAAQASCCNPRGPIVCP